MDLIQKEIAGKTLQGWLLILATGKVNNGEVLVTAKNQLLPNPNGILFKTCDQRVLARFLPNTDYFFLP